MQEDFFDKTKCIKVSFSFLITPCVFLPAFLDPPTPTFGIIKNVLQLLIYIQHFTVLLLCLSSHNKRVPRDNESEKALLRTKEFPQRKSRTHKSQ